MPKHDKSHFDKYTPQNQAKHKILGAYLPAYLKALKNRAGGFHYIDGFAGRGKYEDEIDGSTLLALKKMDEAGVLTKSTISLVESNSSFFNELNQNIKQAPLTSNLYEPPLFCSGYFTDFLEQILNRSIYQNKRVATFAFIDPCGVDGIFMADIVEILKRDFGEVLLFFNYDAVNRLIGGFIKKTHDQTILKRVFGSEKAVKALIPRYEKAVVPSEKEKLIWQCFVWSLKKLSNAKYFVPFQFQAKEKARTSHYLVHICCNPLGFRLMKEVMWEAGKDDTDDFGKLKFLNDRERGRQFKMFNDNKDKKKEEVLKEIQLHPCRVLRFTKEWVESPTDSFSEKAYKAILLELEADGEIVIFDKNNQQPKPASSRRKYRGGATLGPAYWLRAKETNPR